MVRGRGRAVRGGTLGSFEASLGGWFFRFRVVGLGVPKLVFSQVET